MRLEDWRIGGLDDGGGTPSIVHENVRYNSRQAR
jgi:hypothetical protein